MQETLSKNLSVTNSGANSIRNNTFEDEQENGSEDIKIFDNFNKIILSMLEGGEYDTEQVQDLINPDDPLAYMVYSENLNQFPDEFNQFIFEEEIGLGDTIENLSPVLIREVNELWKFMYFLFSCLKHVGVGKECFFCKFII